MALDDYRRVMITGGAGFIGSHLCEEVLRCGKPVVAVDDLSTGRESNLPPGVDFIRMDIAAPDGLQEAMRNVDLVFHVAAQPSTRLSIEDPERDFRSNALGTYNVLAAARRAGVRKFIYTSSSAVYGEPASLPISEADLPIPLTPYGASKLSGEHYCTVFTRVYGLPCTCLRPFNVYGTRENLATSLDEVARYTLAIVAGQPVTVYGDGTQTRDFVHVKDVARAHVLAADCDDGTGKVFNVGTGVEISINELVGGIERVTGRKAAIEHSPWPEGDIRREFADISLARAVLGYAPQMPLAEGIREIAGSPQAERTETKNETMNK